MPTDRFDFGALEARLLGHAPLHARSRAWQLPAGAHVLRQGQACSDIFLLRAGLVKIHYATRDGKEWVKSFIVDRGLFGSRTAQLAGSGSAFSATCIEDSSLLALPYPAFLETVLRDTALMGMLLRFNEWLSLKKEQREYDLLCRSAEDRYLGFLAGEAVLARRLTQADIARYLGITPIALSRIRRRLRGPANGLAAGRAG